MKEIIYSALYAITALIVIVVGNLVVFNII